MLQGRATDFSEDGKDTWEFTALINSFIHSDKVILSLVCVLNQLYARNICGHTHSFWSLVIVNSLNIHL